MAGGMSRSSFLNILASGLPSSVTQMPSTWPFVNGGEKPWRLAGVAYAGVPFKSLFVNMTALKNRAIVSLLDDYQNNCPLRGDLGDRPDEWLDLRGCGLMKVSE